MRMRVTVWLGGNDATLGGVSRGPSAPLRWSRSENRALAHRSPRAWQFDARGLGRRAVFVTQALKSAGERILAWFGSAGLLTYDFSGKKLWQRDLGRQRHTWGYGTSPVIHGNRVFLNFGPGERSFLVALDKTSGRTLWQVDLPAGKGDAFHRWTAEDTGGSRSASDYPAAKSSGMSSW